MYNFSGSQGPCEPEKLYMDGRPFWGLAFPYRGERRFGSMETCGARAGKCGGSAGTEQRTGTRNSGDSSTVVWPGGKASGRPAARSLRTFRRSKEYSGDCAAAWEERRSSEATAVPRVGEAQIADGGCTCLSAL